MKRTSLSRALKGHSSYKGGVIIQQSSLGTSSRRFHSRTKATEASSSPLLDSNTQISLLRQELADGIERVEFLQRGIEKNTRQLHQMLLEICKTAAPTPTAATRFAPAAAMRDQIAKRLQAFYASLSNLPTRISQLLAEIPPSAIALATAVFFATTYVLESDHGWIVEAWAERSSGWKVAASTVMEDCRSYVIERLTPKADELETAVCSHGVAVSAPSIEVSSVPCCSTLSTEEPSSSSLCEAQLVESACSDDTTATTTLEETQEEVSPIDVSSTSAETVEQALVVKETTESVQPEQGN